MLRSSYRWDGLNFGCVCKSTVPLPISRFSCRGIKIHGLVYKCCSVIRLRKQDCDDDIPSARLYTFTFTEITRYSLERRFWLWNLNRAIEVTVTEQFVSPGVLHEQNKQFLIGKDNWIRPFINNYYVHLESCQGIYLHKLGVCFLIINLPIIILPATFWPHIHIIIMSYYTGCHTGFWRKLSRLFHKFEYYCSISIFLVTHFVSFNILHHPELSDWLSGNLFIQTWGIQLGVYMYVSYQLIVHVPLPHFGHNG